MSNRFQGEAHITFPDGKKELRQVVILAPYVQTSDSIRDIDYSHALVVDIQTMEFDFKTQMIEMASNPEATSYRTFLEYAHKTTFRTGANVLQWLHQKNQIHRVPAEEAFIIIGNGGNAKRFRVSEVNAQIKADNEAQLAQQDSASAYSDPSMNPENVQPASIERTGNPHKEQTLNESVSPEEVVADVASTASVAPASSPEGEVDLYAVPGVTLFDDNGNPVTPAAESTATAPETPVSQQTSNVAEAAPSQDMTEVVSRLDALESLLSKKTKTQDSVVSRLIKRYDLTEVEAVKAIESAGKRKEKKKAKEEAQQAQQK